MANRSQSMAADRRGRHHRGLRPALQSDADRGGRRDRHRLRGAFSARYASSPRSAPGFIKTRNIPLIILLPLAVIGLLERHGLRERAQIWISGIKAATAGRLLIVYLLVRELTAAVGLTGLGGHPQMVRPLLAPMAEGAAEARYGKLSDAMRFKLRAYSAATDNVGLFFGEDIFVAFGAIVLMATFLKEAGIVVEPMHVAVWGIPTAICAFLDPRLPAVAARPQARERELGALTSATSRGEKA